MTARNEDPASAGFATLLARICEALAAPAEADHPDRQIVDLSAWRQLTTRFCLSLAETSQVDIAIARQWGLLSAQEPFPVRDAAEPAGFPNRASE